MSTSAVNSRWPGLLPTMQYIVFGSLILYFGRDLFVPLGYATLISFVLYPLCSWFEKKGVGRMTSILICITLLGVLFLALVGLLSKQFLDFVSEWPKFQSRFVGLIDELSASIANTFNLTADQQHQWVSRAGDHAIGGVWSLLSGTISVSAFSSVMLILIPVYAVLILYYRSVWVDLLCRAFPGKRDNIREMLGLAITAYYNFIKGMGLVYLIVGILNSAGLLLLGIPHAILFGFIASILTFIPYVGIIVGSLLPITMAWVTYDSAWYPLGVVAVFTIVQYLEANLIFPIAVSNRLNVNTLVTLVAIFSGGMLWGISGMILFVPFLGILKIIADHTPELATLADVLGTGAHHKKK